MRHPKIISGKLMSATLLGVLVFVLAACSSRAADKPENGEKPFAINEAEKSTVEDSVSRQKNQLTKIYIQAITEFLHAANKNEKQSFDTLFFGKHTYGQPDDFPDITLPGKIEQTTIRLVTPESGQLLQQERKERVYVNLMGWVEKEKAQFMFVVFSNGAAHQYDYIIDFKFDKATNCFVVDRIEFERFAGADNSKTKRVVVFENGKYLRH